MRERTPWHRRGIRVHRYVYRGYYVTILLFGVLFLLPALMLPFYFRPSADTERTLELVMTALPALIGLPIVWLAVVRLRHPLKTPPRE